MTRRIVYRLADLEKRAASGWMMPVLVAAGVYNLLWGGFVVLFPAVMFDWMGMDQPRYPGFWQCIGMIVGVYGIGYIVAAFNPLRHWPIVLVGFLGKVFGPIGMAGALYMGDLPWVFAINNVTNDLIWLVPFAVILYRAARWHAGGWRHAMVRERLTLGEAMNEAVSHRGESLRELSMKRPQVVVFLRHLGCTFCREMLADLANRREELAARGIGMVIVHMSDPDKAAAMIERYGLHEAARVADANAKIYQAFELERGGLMQLLGPRVWWRGAAAYFGGHGIGKLDGDGFQMPGAFLVKDGAIVRAWRPESVAERADFCELTEMRREPAAAV